MLASIVRASLAHPRIVTALSLLVALLGVAALLGARLDVFPDFAPPHVLVQAEAPGMDASQVEAAITPRTKAIMPVHLAGQMSDMPALMEIAARHGLPVNVLAWGRLDQFRQIVARNPETMIVLDHPGLQQPFAELPKVLALAEYGNLAIKISGACTLSHEPFPYNDIREPLFRIFDAFGFDRCLWGTDWTRAVALLTYAQGVDAFRVMDGLSAGDRAALMGGSLTRIYDWSPGKA